MGQAHTSQLLRPPCPPPPTPGVRLFSRLALTLPRVPTLTPAPVTAKLLGRHCGHALPASQATARHPGRLPSL